MYYKDPEYPGPVEYNVSLGIKEEKETMYPFNSSNINARPPPNWKIHPGPDRYNLKYPKCHMKGQRKSWMFLSKAVRGLEQVESYSLVLDGSQYELKLQHLAGNPTQLWTLESTDHGTFFIINKGNGKVLDIQGGAENRANLITYNKHGGTNQQWHINSDRTIVSAAGNLAVDIYEGKYHAGNRIVAFKTHGNDNQQFHLQHHH
ncbi:RicinB lectin 2 domain containing protein [Asbolus verrucosus]|uniref:RicinB lectin 2 domain containing protein n=1 Tax=Asbolus verrucosus TaxID=1661398 RepID=A0A482WEJ5_ASBVE|nr:RicinB lectin 2 domain containing protein [Asbolus verrucosus]